MSAAPTGTCLRRFSDKSRPPTDSRGRDFYVSILLNMMPLKHEIRCHLSGQQISYAEFYFRRAKRTITVGSKGRLSPWRGFRGGAPERYRPTTPLTTLITTAVSRA